MLTHPEQVRIIAKIIGRNLRFEQLKPEEGAALWRAQGLDEETIEFKLFLADENNLPDEARVVSTTVSDVTGRPARRFEQWVLENATAFSV